MSRCAKKYVVKPPLIDVKYQFSYFTHNNWPKLKLDPPREVTYRTVYYYQLSESYNDLY